MSSISSPGTSQGNGSLFRAAPVITRTPLTMHCIAGHTRDYAQLQGVYEQVQESALSHYSTVVEHDRTPNAFLGTDSSDTLGNCWPPKGALL